MIDREKVIKEFEHLLNAARGNYFDFVDLTVDEGKEILSLLKEQEADAEIEGGGRDWWYVCGECRAVIDSSDSYCSKCGRRIRWKRLGGDE